MATADIVARLRLNADQFSSEFNSRMSGIENTVASASRRITGLLSGFGVGIGVAEIEQVAKAALDYAGSLGETSRAIGVTVEQYQILTRAAIENGSSQEGMSRSVAILNRTLGQARAGVPAAVEAFRALRIDPRQFTDAGEVLPTVMDRIRGLATQSEQAAAAQRLMGRGAAEMIPFLVQGSAGYEQMADAARRAGLITADMADKADEAQDKLAALALTLRTRLGMAIVDLIPQIEQVAAGLEGMFDPMADGAERNFERVTAGLHGVSHDISLFLHEFQDLFNGLGGLGDHILDFMDGAGRLGRNMLVYGSAGVPGMNPLTTNQQLPAYQPIIPHGGADHTFNFADRYDRAAQDRALDQALDELQRRNARGGYSPGGGPFLSYSSGASRRNGGDTGDQSLDLSPSHHTSPGDQIAIELASRLATTAERFTGLSERGDNSTLRSLFSEANINIDPNMVKWCAAFVQAVLATNGLPTVHNADGSASLGARSFLNYGTATTDPHRGDIVVLRRGNNEQEGHVGFYEGTDAHGGVRVLGGNTNNRVGITTANPRDVLGYRRAPSPADQAQQEQHSLEQQQQILRTMAAQTDQQVEALRLGTQRNEGLTHEASLQGALSEARRGYEQEIARLDVTRRDDQQKETDGLQAQLGIFQQQATTYAGLLRQHGDRAKLSAADRAAETAAAAAMNGTLATANAMKATAADNLAIRTATVTAEHHISDAMEDGAAAARKQAEVAAFSLEAQEKAQHELDRIKDESTRRQEDQFRGLADLYEQLFSGHTSDIWKDFKRAGLRAIAEIAAAWTLAQMTGQQFNLGATVSSMGAGGNLGPLGSILGMFTGKGSAGGGGGAAKGDPIESILGLLGPASGGKAGGLLGSLGGAGSAISAAGPYAAAAYAAFTILQQLGVFSSAKRGSATLGMSGGSLGVGSTRGNDSTSIGNATGALGSVVDGLNRIAETLGGSVTGGGSVSIGQRDGNWRVDTTGHGITKTKKGAKDFGDDQEAAVRFAIADALKDGVIAGISDASQHILQSGQDLDKAIQKATMIESIPKLLKQHLDPVGAALDDLNEKWAKTIAALKEGGASTEQMADAQKLYKIELADTVAQTAEASASLKEFLKSLNFGSSSPYSLRDQEAQAAAALQPFLDQIDAGGSIDQQGYQSAAQSYLDIERQLNGSTGAFFEAMDKIQDYTNRAIDKIDSAVPIRTAVDPFVEATAGNTATLVDQNTNIIDLLGRIAAGMGGVTVSAGSSFIGGGGGFSNVQAA
jgi:uncharacterized protein (TIGR02594 family)